MHALSIARKLKIPRVVFPVGAGVMSALGLLSARCPSRWRAQRRMPVDDIDAARSSLAIFAALDRMRPATCAGRRGKPKDIRIVRRLDMRYHGQGHEIEVTLPEGGAAAPCLRSLPELFAEAYEKAIRMRLRRSRWRS